MFIFFKEIPAYGNKWNRMVIYKENLISSAIQYCLLKEWSELSLLLLSHFSRVRLCATPQTAAHQASPFLGLSRQEHWSGLPFPSPMHQSEKWKWSRSVVSDSSDLMDCSLPGSSVRGIFQAKVLEWGAIAFSEEHPSRYLFFCTISPTTSPFSS